MIVFERGKWKVMKCILDMSQRMNSKMGAKKEVVCVEEDQW